MRDTPIRPAVLRHWYLPALLLAFYPASFWIPHRWTWENGVIENAQLLMLICAGAWAVAAWWRLRPAPTAPLALCAVPIWAVLAGREASWGAIFFGPLAVTHAGPVFSSSHLWYKPGVAPVALALLLAAFAGACRYRIDRLFAGAIAARCFPWMAMAVAIAAGAAATCAEGRLHCVVPPHGQGFEELAELVGYAALFIAQAVLLRHGYSVRAGARTAARSLAPERLPTD